MSDVQGGQFIMIFLALLLGDLSPKTSKTISRPRNASVQPRPGNAKTKAPTGSRDLSWAPCPKKLLFLLVASTHLKNRSQLGNPPQIEVKIKNILKPPPRNTLKEC